MAAFTPRPREANAVQRVQKFAPPKRFASAWIHALRAVRTVKRHRVRISRTRERRGHYVKMYAHVGLHGWRVNASRKRWRKTVFPPVVLNIVSVSLAYD